MKTLRNAGFTLLELSIVLVIIGLIIGGILVGQDLIRAAEVRSTIAQVEKYNSAVNTFRTKFNGIPGDLAKDASSYFNLFTLSNSSSVGFGDGNGLIEGGAAAATDPIGETLVFWRHLSDANLVDGSLGNVGNSAIVPTTGVVTGTVTNASQSLPPSKLSGVTLFVVYSASGINYFQLMPVTTVTTTGYTFSTTGITPIQSFGMDVKLDDGQPNTGIVIARDTGSTNGVNGLPSTAATSTPNTCEIGATATDTTNTYNRSITSGGTDTSCSVRFRFN